MSAFSKSCPCVGSEIKPCLCVCESEFVQVSASFWFSLYLCTVIVIFCLFIFAVLYPYTPVFVFHFTAHCYAGLH